MSGMTDGERDGEGRKECQAGGKARGLVADVRID